MSNEAQVIVASKIWRVIEPQARFPIEGSMHIARSCWQIHRKHLTGLLTVHGDVLQASLVAEGKIGGVAVHLASPGMVATDLLAASASSNPHAARILNILAEEPRVVARWLAPRMRVRISWNFDRCNFDHHPWNFDHRCW